MERVTVGNRMVKAGLIEKVTSEQRPEKTKKVSQVGNSRGGSQAYRSKKGSTSDVENQQGGPTRLEQREIWGKGVQ